MSTDGFENLPFDASTENLKSYTTATGRDRGCISQATEADWYPTTTSAIIRPNMTCENSEDGTSNIAGR
jgi:hypothetical protein